MTLLLVAFFCFAAGAICGVLVQPIPCQWKDCHRRKQNDVLAKIEMERPPEESTQANVPGPIEKKWRPGLTGPC